MDKIELWKSIPGYDGRYEISSFGRVRTNNFNHTGKTVIMKLSTNTKGYLQVCLTKHSCGFHEDYLYKAIRKNYISLTAVNVLSNKYEINPVKYVIGWKGGNG